MESEACCCPEISLKEDIRHSKKKKTFKCMDVLSQALTQHADC